MSVCLASIVVAQLQKLHLTIYKLLASETLFLIFIIAFNLHNVLTREVCGTEETVKQTGNADSRGCH